MLSVLPFFLSFFLLVSMNSCIFRICMVRTLRRDNGVKFFEISNTTLLSCSTNAKMRNVKV